MAHARTKSAASLSCARNKYGDDTLAVAAYNAGSRTIDNLIKKYGDPRTGAISQQDFVSHLPVSATNDTQAYVRNILTRAGRYNGG
jgi:soluble lytic murein transglycosylase